jgi:isopentenyl diphosphate isomerase/L-lactate dehydrogenase-like FMN-dependent dehydrogenase
MMLVAGNQKALIFANLLPKGIQTTADVVKLVDTHVSEACVARHAGSTPAIGTKKARLQSRAFLFLIVAY